MHQRIAPPKQKPSFKEIRASLPFIFRFLFSVAPGVFVLRIALAIIVAPAASFSVIAVKRATDALVAQDLSSASRWMIVLIAAVVLTVVVDAISEYVSDRLRYQVEYVAEGKILDQLIRLPYWTLEDSGFQQLVAAIQRKLWVLMSVTQSFLSIVAYASEFIGLAALFVFLPWPAIIGIVLACAVRIRLSASESEWEWSIYDRDNREGRRAQYYRDKLYEPRSLLALRSWDLNEGFLQSWKDILGSLMPLRLKGSLLSARNVLASDVLQLCGFAIGIWMLLYQKAIDIGVITAFISSYPRLWTAFFRMVNTARYIQKEWSFFPILKQFFDLKTERETGKTIVPGAFVIRFEDVWFRYPGGKEDILRGIELTIHEGDHIALAGLNGAGKSTLLKLLMGVYEPTRGRITVNGVDLVKIKPSVWRRALAFMTQDALRFDDPLKQQILYGDVAREENIERLQMAVNMSTLQLILQDLPKGIETHAGKQYAMPEDNAIELSGGQNQLVAIARTLYRDARVYVFDEPTSAVDAEKEERFFAAIPNVLQSKIVMYVSHRFSTLRRAERIIVLDQGRIIEDGTHEELMTRQGRYAELFTLQAKMYQ